MNTKKMFLKKTSYLRVNHLKALGTKMENTNVLVGKVAIVTGSTDGIGLAIARRFAQDGAHVLLSSRKQENVDKAVKQLKDEGLSVTGIVCHVGVGEHREKLITKALELHGKIDILVCNAAVNPFVGPLLDTTEEMWEKVFHVNVISTFLMVKLAVPHMQKQGKASPSILDLCDNDLPFPPYIILPYFLSFQGGSVVFCSSFIGYIPLPYIGPYAITKTTLLGLTNILAQSLQSMNIRVNGLALGLINTRFSDVIRKTKELEALIIPIGIQRSGKPEECAGVASFLCSKDASYINGENIAVTGCMLGRL